MKTLLLVKLGLAPLTLFWLAAAFGRAEAGAISMMALDLTARSVKLA